MPKIEFVQDDVLVTLTGNWKDLFRLIRRILELLGLIPGQATTIRFTKEGKEIDMLQITDTQQCNVSLVIKDSKGRPANVDGIPVWSSTDDAIATATTAADGMSAAVIAHAPGLCQITVNADADLGTGVAPLIGFLDTTVTGGMATIIELIPGTITEQPS